MTKTTTIETRRLANGTLVRLQQRDKAFDVIRNSTGLTWRYVEKAVPEQQARNTFDLLTMENAQ